METNIFEELKQKKEKLINLAKAALEKKWIEKDAYDSIINKLKNDTLTIGVIGQMKCGKSTFLNAFLFEDEILPAATTPMTAALSVITYGETKNIEAEFYNKNEWQELQIQAERDIEKEIAEKKIQETDTDVISKIKAAKELVEKANKIGSQLSSLLGTIKKDDFENLIEYVGADGRYVAITKSVTIHYPKEWLKGVEIVDTPGFNDPLVSREERTQEFLKKADVVVMLLYAGRAFDATDRDIVFEKVRSVGIGKILIGVNKYDLCYENGETEDEIIKNVEDEIKKSCKAYNDSMINELLDNQKPILVSANMALMAKMPIEKIKNNETLKFHYNKALESFGISSQKQMFEKSLINNLENAIREMIEKSKNEILLKKPQNMIFQVGQNALKAIEIKSNELIMQYKILSTPDDDLQERIDNMGKAQRRIERKIDGAKDDLAEKYNDIILNFKHKLEDTVDEAKTEIGSIIESGRNKKMENRVGSRIEILNTREIPRLLEKCEKELGSTLKNTAMDLSDEIDDIISKYVEDSDDLQENFIQSIKRNLLGFDENDKNVSENTNDDSKEERKGLGKLLLDFVVEATTIYVRTYTLYVRTYTLPFKTGYNFFTIQDKVRDAVNETFSQYKTVIPKKIDELKGYKSQYIEMLGTNAVSTLVQSLVDTLEEAKGNKEEKLHKADLIAQDIEAKKSEKTILENQITEMKKMMV